MTRTTRRSFLVSGGALAGSTLAGVTLAGGRAFAAESADPAKALPPEMRNLRRVVWVMVRLSKPWVARRYRR